MDLNRVGLEGEIDATKLLRIANVAQELGLRVVDLSQDPIPDTNESVASGENVEPVKWALNRDDFREFAYENIELTDNPPSNGIKLGMINRAWTGFLNTSRSESDPNFCDPKAIKDELGVAPPSFKNPVFRNRTVFRQEGKGKIPVLSENKTDGLDLDQTGRYLIAVAGKLQELDSNEGDFNSTVMRAEIKRFLPARYSFAGYSLLCDYIIYNSDGNIAEDIEIDSLKGARNYFAKLTSKINPNVKLKYQTI